MVRVKALVSLAAVPNFIPRRACGRAYVQVFVKSQLIVVHLGGFEQAANLHGSLTLFLLRFGRRLFALFCKELCIVAGELLQRDQEVSKNDLESVKVRVRGEESIDERPDLRATEVRNSSQLRRGKTYVWRLGNAVASRLPTKFRKKSRFGVPAGARSAE